MPSRATTDQSLRVRANALSLAAVLSASFGVGLIFGFQPPLIALVLERGGASSFEIGAVSSVSTVAIMLCSPLYPSAIRRLGSRRAVILGIAVSTVVLFVMPLLPGFQGWFVLRFVTGCSLGLEWIASEIWLNRLATDQTRGTVMGTYATVFAAGVMSGPLLLQLTGTSGWRPFVVGAVCLALTALPLLAARDPEAGDATGDRLQWLRIARAAPIVMLAALIVTVFLAGNVILQLPIGRLGDRLGRYRVLALCAAVCVIGPILLSAVMGVPWLVWPLLLLWGGTMYGFYTQGIALLGESYPHAELADANTVYVVVYCAGGIVGPILGGLAMDNWSPNGLLVFLSAAPILLAAALLRRPVR